MNLPWADIGRLTVEHLQLVGMAMSAALVVALPLGVWMSREARLRPWALGFANVMQTIPSLAMLGFLIPIAYIGGVGTRSAVVALVLYALLPILKNTLTGILQVDPAVRDSAIALGMTPRQLLWRVELPLAAPTILAGVHIATVTCIGTATIAAAIGAGGLGVLIFRGIATVNTELILAGAIPAALLSLVTDGVLSWVEHRLWRSSSPSSSADARAVAAERAESSSGRRTSLSS
ncbi:MAG: ABC transporter permease [Bryobacterales bacterium]|jgi:osmoprotectant transport system permease protein|nr:ABC transporter permease [Bryobacterales bacterium]